ncbi:MAG: hypothetical protein WCZ90_04345 [Melioribacteraceae bacterium]
MDEKELVARKGCLKILVVFILGFCALVLIGVATGFINSCEEKKSMEKAKNDNPNYQNTLTITETDTTLQKLIEVENRRKEIFRVDGQWYKLSVDQSMKKYPDDLDRQTAYQEKLEKSFRKQVEKKYHLKKGELDSIILEGGQKRWSWE